MREGSSERIELLRVLMICPQYRPIVGGYERAAERLSGALVARGHQVTVIAERREGAWPAREVEHGVVVRRLRCVYRPRLHLLTALTSLALFLVARGRSFDVWHVHQYGLHAALAIGLGKVLRRPVVLKITSSADQGIAQRTVTGPLPWLVSRLLKRASAVVTLTRETEREARAFGIALERIHCLGNGVDSTMFHRRSEMERADLKVRLRIGPHLAVIYVGRLSYEKDPVCLVRAWIKAQPRLPVTWKLILIGDGPMRGALETIIGEECLEGDVLLAGQQANIEEWLGAADVYAICSRNEGLSNTLLEAMASGLPVVATRVSGMSELVEESGAGMVAGVGDVDGLAEALVRLAADEPLRERMGAAACRVVEHRYALDVVAESHEALYRRLLAVQAP